MKKIEFEFDADGSFTARVLHPETGFTVKRFTDSFAVVVTAIVAGTEDPSTWQNGYYLNA